VATFICREKAQLDQAAEMVANLAPDKPWRITIGRYQMRRSLEENAMFHAIVAAIASETGNSPGALKEHFKAEFGPTVTLEIDGKVITVPKPSREYTVGEMAEMITNVQAFASSELGITV
jgi:AraC-like DNA-binding protein